MSDLSLLRLHPRDEAELRWYFQCAEGELGLRSSFDTIISAAQGGKNKGSKPVGAARKFAISVGQHNAAEKARRVERRLTAMTARDRRTLAAAYGGLVLPRAAFADFEKIAPPGIAPALLFIVAKRRVVEQAKRAAVAARAAEDEHYKQARAAWNVGTPLPVHPAEALDRRTARGRGDLAALLAKLRGKDAAGKRLLSELVAHARTDLAVAGAAYEVAR